jgi:phenylacetate-CoA ligase
LRNAALSAESGQSAARLNELLTALQSGDMACTCLFKDDVFPIIRFSTHDVSAFRTDKSPMGLTLRRIAGLQGRSDNMVKLRGINIYPTGLSVILTESDPQPLHA